jgi:DnaJ family protein B protein 4
MSENYYDILGISNDCNQDDIKKAYRKLSFKYHPDKNQNNPDAVNQFQKIGSAYETLSDSSKRKQYDLMENNPFFKMGGMNQSMDIPLDDLIGSLFGGVPFGGMPFGGSGFPNPKVHIFHGGNNPFINMSQALEKPTPIIANITIPIESILKPSSMPLDVERWVIENGTKKFEKETIYIDIPQGIDDDEIIVLRNKGNIINEKLKGDIKIFIHIENNSNFKRSGLDLIYDKNISLKEALCGFSFELTFLNGKSYTLNNNKGNIIPSEYKKLIPNMGIQRGDHKGNLIIHFHLTFPNKLTDDQIDKLENIL